MGPAGLNGLREFHVSVDGAEAFCTADEAMTAIAEFPNVLVAIGIEFSVEPRRI
jgi:hypothetical protein